jgi:hypothetical protein
LLQKQSRRRKVLRSRLKKLNRPASARKLRQPSIYSRTESIGEKKSKKGIWSSLFLLLFIGGLIYLVFVSGVFSVETVAFSPTKYVNREELMKAAGSGGTFLDNNIITYGLFGLSSRLKKVTGVDKVSVRRISQHKLEIKIVEKAPLLVWQTLDRKYLVDDTGVIWGNYEDKYLSLPVFVDTKNLPVDIGNKVLPQGSIVFFRDLGAIFGDTGAKAVKYEIMDIVSDLKVTTDAGWFVYFDTTRSAKGEVVSLQRVLAEAKGAGTKLEYIDLRIANRIFYK